MNNSPKIPRKVPGKSKQQLVLTGIRYVFTAICKALHYLHTNNIVYNDLKPENIIVDALSLEAVTRKTKVSLIDFGLSFFVGESKEYSGGGTPEYSPPEKYTAECDVGTASDIFSFGLLLHSVCTQKQLFDHGKVPQDIRYDVLLAAIGRLQDSLRVTNKGAYAYSPVKEVVARTVKVHKHLRATAEQLLAFEFFATDKDMEIAA